MALASASGRSRDGERRRRGCRRSCPARSGCRCRSRGRAASARRAAGTVTVAGAASVAATRPGAAERSRAAAKPSSSRSSSPERSARVPIASRPSAAKCIRVGSSCSALAVSASISMPPSTRSLPVSLPLTSGSAERVGDRGVDIERPIRVAPTARSRALPVMLDALADAGGGSRVTVGVDGAGRLDQRQRRQRRDVGRVQRQLAGDRRGAGLGEVAGQPSGPTRARGRRASGCRRRWRASAAA